MGVTPYSDTQQKIARHVANIKHHGSMAQICNELHCALSLFLPAFLCGAAVYDSRIDDGNTALTFKRIKSPDRFTGGRAVYWMCVTFTVTLLEDHPFFYR